MFIPSFPLWSFILSYGMALCSFFMQEIYSIKLPGDPKLGEGKPENQNHAIVFTRGNAMQTIDMNQVSMQFFFLVLASFCYKFLLLRYCVGSLELSLCGSSIK